MKIRKVGMVVPTLSNGNACGKFPACDGGRTSFNQYSFAAHPQLRARYELAAGPRDPETAVTRGSPPGPMPCKEGGLTCLESSVLIGW